MSTVAVESKNPLFNGRFAAQREVSVGFHPMTVAGTVAKLGILFALMFAGAGGVWSYARSLAASGETWQLWFLLLGPALVALPLVIVCCFTPQWSSVLAPAYAICEGVSLGSLSSLMELQYPGIALQSVAVTFGVFGGMYGLYAMGVLRFSVGLWKFLMVSMVGILFTYLLDIVLIFAFGMSVPMIHQGGWLGIAFSLFVVTIATLNLIIDFHQIELGVKMRAPKYYEWYTAMGLLVTLVWMYVEIINLLLKMRGDR